MNTPSLYRATHDMQHAIMSCCDEDGVLDIERVNAIEFSYKERAIATVAVHKRLSIQASGLKAEFAEIATQYEAAINRLESNAERLKNNLMASMQATGVTSFKSDDGLLSATLSLGHDVSVELDEGIDWPMSLCNKPKPPSPSKTLIKNAILAGEAVQGARLVHHDRLTIK